LNYGDATPIVLTASQLLLTQNATANDLWYCPGELLAQNGKGATDCRKLPIQWLLELIQTVWLSTKMNVNKFQ
jgi:hypothetical protein